jgi:hypothetical protein
MTKPSNYIAIHLTDSVFNGAPKKKVSASTFEEFMAASYDISYTHALLMFVQLLREAREHNLDLDTVQGDMEIELKKKWNEMATTKIGHLVYKAITLEDIIYAKDPAQLISKGIHK